MITLTGACAAAPVFANLGDSARGNDDIQDAVAVTDVIKPVSDFKA